MILPDTSVWIEYLRAGSGAAAEHLDQLIEAGEVATCGPVLAELLAGGEGERREAILETVGDLPWAELDHAAWQAVGVLAGRLRRAGQRLPLTDLVIAVAAARAGFELWSLDADFARIAAELEELVLHELPSG